MANGNTNSAGGGDHPLARAIGEALDRLASPDARDVLMRRAVVAAGLDALPEDPAHAASFIIGPLYDVVQRSLGHDSADALLIDLAPIVERASSQMTSGVRRSRTTTKIASGPPVVLLATGDRDRGQMLAASTSGAVVQRVQDVFGLVQGVERNASSRMVIVIDCRLPAIQPTTLAALGGLLPEGARIVLWGADERVDAQLADVPGAAGWERVRGELTPERLARLAGGRESVRLPKKPAGPRRVLVADADPAYRAAIGTMLRKRGYDVLTAPDGYIALTMGVEMKPDLLVADYDMPVMGGEQVARLLGEMLGGSAPPAVLLTATRGLRPGGAITAVVSKTASQRDILSALEKALGPDSE